MAKRFRLLADVAPLRESRAFRRLWTGTTLSTVGGGPTRYAIPLQIFERAVLDGIRLIRREGYGSYSRG